MSRVVGLVLLLMLAMGGAAAAAECSAPGVNPRNDEVVDTTMQAPSGKPCGLHFHNSGGNALSGYAIAQHPAHGTASIGPFNVIYRSRPGYVGSDSFIYQRSGVTALGAPVVRKVRVSVTVVP
jgi:hypothetical protein